jgi:hypothetical protein
MSQASMAQQHQMMARTVLMQLWQLLVHGLDTAQAWHLQKFHLWLDQQIKCNLGHE